MKSCCYKMKIRKEIKRVRKVRPTLTYQKIANLIGVEPSYLSRFLGDTDVHFSDELLFRLLAVLELDWSQIDMIFLLKEYDRSCNPQRKKFLLARIRLGRIRRWQSGIKKIKDELNEVISIIQDV